MFALPYNREKREENLTVWLEKLNHLKKLSGMTIEQISAASCVPKGTLNKLFSGQTKDPQLSTVSAVVHCMGYTLDDLSDNTVNGKVVLTPQQSALTLTSSTKRARPRLWSTWKTSSLLGVIKKMLRLAWLQRTHKK